MTDVLIAVRRRRDIGELRALDGALVARHRRSAELQSPVAFGRARSACPTTSSATFASRISVRSSRTRCAHLERRDPRGSWPPKSSRRSPHSSRSSPGRPRVSSRRRTDLRRSGGAPHQRSACAHRRARAARVAVRSASPRSTAPRRLRRLAARRSRRADRTARTDRCVDSRRTADSRRGRRDSRHSVRRARRVRGAATHRLSARSGVPRSECRIIRASWISKSDRRAMKFGAR